MAGRIILPPTLTIDVWVSCSHFMKYIFLFTLSIYLLFVAFPLAAQDIKFDTTVMSGKIGFRVFCKNKAEEENRLEIKLIGFINTAREPNFFIRGRVSKAVLDDLNNDGYPDLLLYINTGEGGIFGTVYAFASDQNKAIIPCALPDVMANGKLSQGYKGHDEFSLMEGSLLQKFPLYKPGDDKDKPTGGKRIIQYHLAPIANGKYEFKVMQSYDIK
jgi:hypothetical protein